MLVKYEKNKCNIKSCENENFDSLLCFFHYKKYITDKKIEEKTKRLKRIVEKKTNLKDKLLYFLNILIHYTTAIHVAYIEHFPLETIFLHFENKIYKKAKLNFTIEEFIADFDYQENRYLDNLKVKFDTKFALQPLEIFAKNIKSNRITFRYFVIWLIYLFVLIFIKTTNFQVKYQNVWDILFLIFMLGLGIIHSGIRFSNSAKEIINKGIENKLYERPEDNRTFIKNSHYYLQKIRTLNESFWSLKGGIFAFFLTIFIETICNNKAGIYELLLALVLIIISYLLGIRIFSVLWENRFILPIIKNIKDKKFKFKLLSLDRNLGIMHFKNYLRNLLVYNFFIISSYWILFSIFYTGFNFTLVMFIIFHFHILYNNNPSVISIFRVKKIIKNQFKKLKKNELNKLEKSDSVSRITDYTFIENLKPNIFFKKKLILNFFFYSLPILFSYLISKYDNQIIKFIQELINIMGKTVGNAVYNI